MKADYELTLLKACRNCGSDLLDFLSYYDVPIAGTYLEKKDLGKEPLLPLTVALCSNCGLIQLREIIASSIYTGYRFVGTGSVSYRTYLDRIADSLIIDWHLYSKKIVEIGCSDGYLLRQLCEKGKNQVFGYEPSHEIRRDCVEKGVPVSGSFFSCNSLFECPILPADAIVMRHVLEHVDKVHDFLNAVSTALAEDGLLIIEVPDVEVILSKHLYFHFYHEHLSYFSFSSLERLLSHHKFKIIWSKITDIHGGSLYVVCSRLQRSNTESLVVGNGRLQRICRTFKAGMRNYLDRLHYFIERQCADGVSFAGYGASHRTTVACSLAGITQEQIRYLVDKNSYLHGLYTPGAHLPIYSPEKLYQNPVDSIVIFASSFEREIIREQWAFKEIGGRFASLFPEPRYIP